MNTKIHFDNKRIIVALDFPDAKTTMALLGKLDPGLCRVKIGKELFTRSGPEIVRQIRREGFEIFLDLKFHDIPNTVAGAVSAAVDLGAWMVNVHASGSKEDMLEIGLAGNPCEMVLRLAMLSSDCGMDGVVCSAMDIVALREHLAPGFLLVTPGIRPVGDFAGDQKRIAGPGQAIALGSSYLVIGRPVTQADNPVQKLSEIMKEIQGKISELC
jgi:orotidine-5'-phosphate decarboxylase